MISYIELVKNVLTTGELSSNRTGVDTIRCFNQILKLNLLDGFPIITTRKIPYKSALGELSAFLHSSTRSSEFRNFGCPFWDQYGENLGPVYGYQWSNFGGVDQIDWLINEIKTNPVSRRLILSTWNVADLDKMVLPPCHLMAQYYVTDRYLDCVVYMRSSDIMLGLPSDIIVYAMLQTLLAHECGLVARRLEFILVDCHIYANQIDQAKILIERKPFNLPSIEIVNYTSLCDFLITDVNIVGYKSHASIKFEYNI